MAETRSPAASLLRADRELRRTVSRDRIAERNIRILDSIRARVGHPQRVRTRTESLRRDEVVVARAIDLRVRARGIARLERGDRVAMVADLDRRPERVRAVLEVVADRSRHVARHGTPGDRDTPR